MKRIAALAIITLMLAGFSSGSAPVRGEYIGAKVVQFHFQMPDESRMVVPQLIAYFENGSYPSNADEFSVDNIIEAGGQLFNITQ